MEIDVISDDVEVKAELHKVGLSDRTLGVLAIACLDLPEDHALRCEFSLLEGRWRAEQERQRRLAELREQRDRDVAEADAEAEQRRRKRERDRKYRERKRLEKARDGAAG